MARLARDTDRSAVCLRDVLHNRQAYADAGCLTSQLGPTPIERLEDSLLIRLRDARPQILDLDQEPLGFGTVREPHRDSFAGR